MEIILSRLNYFGYYITMKNIIILLYWTKLGMFGHAKSTKIPLYYYIWAAPESTGSRHDSRWQQASEIIRYFIDVQKRAKLLEVISCHAQMTKSIFFLRAHCHGKRRLFHFTYRKYCYYFPSSFYGKEYWYHLSWT